MKKPTFYFLVSLITLGFAGGITPAHAAPPPQQQGADTHAQSTIVLKQGLDILGNLLTQLESLISQSSQPIANKAELNSILGAIRINLIGVQVSLAQYNPAIAAYPPTTPVPLVTPKPQKSITAQQAPQIKIESEAAPPPIATTAASVGLSTDWKNFFWPSITLIAVLALIFFLRMREKKEESFAAAPPLEMYNTPRITDNEQPILGEESPIIY